MKQKEIKVLMVEPGEHPKVTTLKNDLDSLQEAVSIGAGYIGLIEIIGLEEGICILCNEEGKLIGLEGNRRLGRDILTGVFYVAGEDGRGNLAYCESLQSITVSKNLTEIKDEAFYRCVNLAIIYYEGTTEQWETIQKGEDWDYYVGKSTSKGTYIIKRREYTVTYNANDGEGTPASQTKTQGIELQLSSEVPTRTGYIFHGWTTSPNGTVEYYAGDVYTQNADITLYAVWREPYIYKIDYDANGGNGAPHSQTKTENVTVKVSELVPTRIGYVFNYWLAGTTLSTEGLESNHNYANSIYEQWEISSPGAKSITLIFDSRTAFESGYDYLNIYDGYGYCTSYTGSSLAGQTIEIQGDYATLTLSTDYSGTKWGFAVISAIAYYAVNPGDSYSTNADVTFYAVWDACTHTWDEGAITTQPTHTAKGIMTYTCTVCGAEKTATIAKQPHVFGEWINISETQHSKTCECGAVKTASHNWDNGIVTIQPTQTTCGEREYTCADCSATKTEPINHVVTYDANGGQNAPASQIKVRETDLALSNVLPVRVGYSFKCWTTNPAGEEKKTLTVDGLESNHNYANYMDKQWVISNPGAKSIQLTFDSRTAFESNHDYLYVYDGALNYISMHTGVELAGKTIEVQGDSVILILYSNSSNTEWGFAVTSAIAYYETYNPGDSYSTDADVTLYAVWEVGDMELSFSGASLTLYDNISVGFKVDKALFETGGYTDPYVVFVFNGTEAKVDTYTLDGDRYVFTFSDIAPNQMNDTISATLYATYDGVVCSSETKEYSVAAYCYNMLGKCSGDEYAEFRTLLVDLLVYGATSQAYTGYNTDAMTDANLTSTQEAWGTSTDRQLESVLNPTYATVATPVVSWKGAGLNLENAVTVRLKFAAASIDGLTLKIVTQSGTTHTISADWFEKVGDVYYAYFNGLNAGQMSETIYMTFYKDGVAVSNTASYSIESYACQKQTEDDAALAELLRAMMRYGDAAYAYVN